MSKFVKLMKVNRQNEQKWFNKNLYLKEVLTFKHTDWTNH